MIDNIIEELRQLRPDIPLDCVKLLLDILRDLHREYPSSARTALFSEVDFVLASLIICTPSKARREIISDFKNAMLRKGYSKERIEGKVRRIEERLDEINRRHPRDFIFFVVRKIGEKGCLSGVDDEEIRKIAHGAWGLLEYADQKLRRKVVSRYKLSPLVIAASAVLLSARYVACCELSEQCLAQALCLSPDLVSEVAYELWKAYEGDSSLKTTRESLQKLRKETCREESRTERPQAGTALSFIDVKVAIKDARREATLPAVIKITATARELREVWRGVSEQDFNELSRRLQEVTTELVRVKRYVEIVVRGLCTIERLVFTGRRLVEIEKLEETINTYVEFLREIAGKLDSEVGDVLQAIGNVWGGGLDLEGLKRELESLASELADVPKRVDEILGRPPAQTRTIADLKEMERFIIEFFTSRRAKLAQYIGEFKYRIRTKLKRVKCLGDFTSEAYRLTLKLHDLTVRAREKPENLAVQLESLVREEQLGKALALAAILDVLCEMLNKEKGTRLPTGNLERVRRIAEELEKSRS